MREGWPVPAEPRITDHRAHVQVPVPAHEVCEMLEVRPTSWLRPFLRLATHQAAIAQPSIVPPAWFRLGRSEDGADGEVTISFDWQPHVPGVFESFRGQVVIEPAGHGANLRLEGLTIAGNAAVDAPVLQGLLDLLAGALVADQRSVG